MTLEDRLVALAGRLGAVVGLEQDWAGQLAGLLNAPQAILAATKTVPGIMRFATGAEALAGTDDAAAVTSLGLAGVLDGSALRKKSAAAITTTGSTYRRLARITDPGDGNGASISLLITGLGAPSSLDRAGGILSMTILADTVRTRIQWLYGPPPLFFQWRRISATVYELWGGFTNKFVRHNVYLLDGNGVTTWGPDSDTTVAPSGLVQVSNLETAWNFTTGVADWDAAGGPDYFENSVRRVPGGLWVSIGVKRADGSAWASGQNVLTFDPSLFPTSGVNGVQVIVNGYSTSGSGWSAGSVALAFTGGTLSVNGPQANVHGLFGSFFVPINGA